MPRILKAELNKFTTKQDFLRPKDVPEDVLIKMKEAIANEREWYKNKKAYRTKEDLESALKRGELVRVGYNEYVYIAKTVEHPVLSVKMADILREIVEQFKEKAPETEFIVIVSMTRTIEDLKLANPLLGEEDPHCKGEAFDIPFEWLRINKPKTYEILKQILEDFKKKGKINFVEERAINMWHVCRNPNYK